MGKLDYRIGSIDSQEIHLNAIDGTAHIVIKASVKAGHSVQLVYIPDYCRDTIVDKINELIESECGFNK